MSDRVPSGKRHRRQFRPPAVLTEDALFDMIEWVEQHICPETGQSIDEAMATIRTLWADGYLEIGEHPDKGAFFRLTDPRQL